AAHEEHAIAEPVFGGDGLGCDQEQPRAAELQPHGVEQTRKNLRQHHAQRQRPGIRRERLGLDDFFLGYFRDSHRQIAHEERRDADDDERHFRHFAETEDDEKNRQRRERRNERDGGDERFERRAHV